MTNQYFTVSSSQIKTDVKKIMKTCRTSRSAARPTMKRSMKPRSLSPIAVGQQVIDQRVVQAGGGGRSGGQEQERRPARLERSGRQGPR